MATTQPAGHDFKTGFEQKLFREGIADLHRGALFVAVRVEFRRGHGGAMNAVAPGLGAEIDDRPADAGGRGVENLVRATKADRHGVDEDIAVVARMERGRAADRRHAKTIAIAADAGDDAGRRDGGCGDGRPSRSAAG